MNSDEIINSIIKPFVVEQPYEVPGEFYMSSSSNTNQRIMMNKEEHYKMNTYHVGTVYILFEKTPRSDSQNIIGVYQDEKTASHAKEYWEERFPDTFFIEKHDVWQE